jgi:hypothetical protein
MKFWQKGLDESPELRHKGIKLKCGSFLETAGVRLILLLTTLTQFIVFEVVVLVSFIGDMDTARVRRLLFCGITRAMVKKITSTICVFSTVCCGHNALYFSVANYCT